MAGSDGFKRTRKSQEAYRVEMTDGTDLVQMAIVYRGDRISVYRDGKLYATHTAKNVDLLSGEDNMAVFGLRHVGGNGSIGGAIEDARIYGRALSVEELKSLKPNEKSAITPFAWWDFENGKAEDRMGVFTHPRLQGGAKIENGALVLGDGAVLVAGRPYKPETPSWPADPPADWLTFHLCHPGPGNAMPGDPNPCFFWKGRYHLHYIYHNYTGFVFAHVSSKDMVHWKWHPTVLCPPTTGHGMFSGTGFFTKEGKPAIIYHGQGSSRNWIQYPADDQFDSWSAPVAVLPKNPDGSVPDIRHWDPDCWLNGDTYYALSGGQNPKLMKSKDLEDWSYLGDVFHKDFPADLGIPKGEDVSCANMFKIGDKWMLLCISHPLGCRYYLGDFKDEHYLPEFHAMMSWNGNHYFAPESMLTEDGRRVMWAWMLNLPIAPTGVQALPRELELPSDGILRMRPLRELETLRYDEKSEKDIEVASGKTHKLACVDGDAYELEVTFPSPKAKEFGVDVLCDAQGEGGIRIAVVGDKKVLRVGGVNAPFELQKGENLTLRIFVDKNFVEVFANERQAAVTAAKKYDPAKVFARVFAEGGDLKVGSVKAWKMKTIYE